MQMDNRIRTILGANGAFSLICGVILLFNVEGLTAAMFVTQSPWQMALYFNLGLALLFFAAILFVLVSVTKLSVPIVWIFIVADATWVSASVLLLLFWSNVFTLAGLVLVVGIALIVGCFGVVQWLAARKISKAQAIGHLGRWRQGALVAALFGLIFSSVTGIFGLIAATQPMPAAPGALYQVNGQSMHMYCRGEGSPTIVADLGVTNWSLHWHSVGDEIAKSTRFCAYDRVGLGWSGPLQSPITPELLVQNLHQLLDQSGEAGPFVLLGHSFGGYVARLYREQYPEQVAGLVLAEAAHEEQWARFSKEVSQATDAAVAMMGTAKTIAYTGGLQLLELPAADPLPTPAQRALQNQAMRSIQFYHSAQQHFAAVPALAAAVGETAPLGQTPLLVLTGGRSADSYCGNQFGVDVPCAPTQQVWEELQAELATLSDRSTHAIAPDARHFIQLDDPSFVVEAVIRFVRRLAE